MRKLSGIQNWMAKELHFLDPTNLDIQISKNLFYISIDFAPIYLIK